MNENDDPWKRLVDATKTAPLEQHPEPPPAVSVKTLRETVQSLILALTWRKWSLLAALIAGLIFLVFFLFFRDDSSSQSPIIPSEPPANPAAP